MKVGTDGVLLGAWAPLPATGHGLDIGTGTGLLALMAAQRADGMDFIGIDIDVAAAAQARNNVDASPFAERIDIEQCALQDFHSGDMLFHAILCNPPYFESSLLPPDASRMTARHTCSLSFEELVTAAARLLHADGYFSVILPSASFDDFHRLCFNAGLHLYRRCDVQATARKAPKRTLACFRHEAAELPKENLILEENGRRSAAYQQLCADFYL